MSLNSLAAKLATNVWLNDKFWAEDVEFFESGLSSNKQELKAVINDQAFEGTNEAVGDGRTLKESTGQKERQTIEVDLPVSANVSFPQDSQRADKLKRISDGSMWLAVRSISEDTATKRVIFVRGNTASHRQRKRTG